MTVSIMTKGHVFLVEIDRPPQNHVTVQLMAAKLRTMRIYDGPTEVHKWVVARNLLGTRR